MTQKIVINEDFEGLNLTEKAVKRLIELGCEEVLQEWEFLKKYLEQSLGKVNFDLLVLSNPSIKRDNKLLVQVIEELGEEASEETLKIIEIPDNVEWHLVSSKGSEWIAEKHRTWR